MVGRPHRRFDKEPYGRPCADRSARRSLSEASLRWVALLLLTAFAADAAVSHVAAQDDAEARSTPAVDASNDDVLNPAGLPARHGQLINVPAPISDSAFARIRESCRSVIEEARRENERAVLILEFQAGANDLGNPLDLARFLTGPEMSDATTVAYLPESIDGHAVLVVAACDEIVMAPAAEIGDAGASEKFLGADVRAIYTDIANRRKTIPTDVLLGMLDDEAEVLVVETDVGREFVLESRLEELKQNRTIVSTEVLMQRGVPGKLSGRDAREFGIATYLASDRRAVATALGLPRAAVEPNPALGNAWRPVRIDLRGAVTTRIANQTQRLIEEEIRRRQANFICLWIEGAGGSLSDSLNLANYLASLDPSVCRTVAYVPNEARGDSALVALGCDQIVMHADATFGGEGNYEIDPRDVEINVEAVEALAEAKYRPTALAAALVDPSLSVFRYVRKSDALVDYFTDVEMESREDADDWEQGERITGPGAVLMLSGAEAEQADLARYLVSSFSEFKQAYDLQDDPTLVEPNWADVLLEALRSPALAGIVLMIAISALYMETQTPGLGIGGLIAALCFLLYFWSQFLGGTAGWLEVLMFIAGIGFLAVEIFVIPGFGIFGLAGSAMIVGSIVLAAQTFIVPHGDYQVRQFRDTMQMLGIAGVGSIGIAYLARQLLPVVPGVNRMLLRAPNEAEAALLSRSESLADFRYLIGSRGMTATKLVPAGKVRFGDALVDVVSTGDLVAVGQEVEVIEARGSRVVVRPVAR